MLVTFSVEVDVGSNAFGSSYVGLSVDTPLPSRIGGTQYTIGLIDLLPLVVAQYRTTVSVNVGTGTHYVVLGYEIPTNLIPAISLVRLKLSGAGTSVERVYGVFDVKQYIYIAFTVDKNGTVNPVSAGQISPGGSPIQSSGGGGIFTGDFGSAMNEVVASMMQIMIPLMMMQMMMGMIARLVAVVA
ncbi:MAG: hypothetical protein QXW98_04665 [Candidatus Caldarchaeum sp.]